MYFRNRLTLALGLTLLTACVEVAAQNPVSASNTRNATADAYQPVAVPAGMSQALEQVSARIEPVVRRKCFERGVSRCDFAIVIDDRPGQPPNAYQTLDPNGRPILGVTVSLLMKMRNQDELAFVMSHEAAHHLAGHIPQTRQTALAGAVLAGVLASTAGASVTEIKRAQNMAAGLAARVYGKEFELEADALGAEIAFEAGYDPVRGSAFFDQLPDPGDQFLGTHPPNARRQAQVAQTTARLRARG